MLKDKQNFFSENHNFKRRLKPDEQIKKKFCNPVNINSNISQTEENNVNLSQT